MLRVDFCPLRPKVPLDCRWLAVTVAKPINTLAAEVLAETPLVRKRQWQK